ncbi:hypothetical protein O3603_07840 [Prevotella sp. 20925_1_30]|uniref:hypothetical protein n=1 Tax=Prevotella sp. 20925_1_30 TaxID=3003679 RepID=UPI00352D50B2
MKKEYITPKTASIEMITHDNIAQFIISSHSVGEDEGLAKPGFFDEEDEEKAASSESSASHWEDD